MPDWRGCVLGALDDMGNVAAGRLTAAYFGTSPIVLGALGGDEKLLMARSDLPNVAPTFAGISGTVNVSGSVNAFLSSNQYNTGTDFNPCNFGANGARAFTATGSFTPQGTVQSLNGGVAQTQMRNVQPTKLVTFYMKL
jgi:hypothetical protein